MGEALIELRQLSKRFGSKSGGILAVDRVSFSVEPGEVLGFLGPNGAGKSTTMKMIAGFLAPTSGTALVNKYDVVESPLKVKEAIGYLPEGAPAYPDMTPHGFLQFIAQVRGLTGDAKKKAIDVAVSRTNIQGVMHQPIDTLSKGFKRRVGLAQAIIHEPRVLILDEPTDGLDPNQKHEVRILIREMAAKGAAGGKAIVLSTHILEEVEAVCTRAIVIAGGRVVADGTPEELMGRSRYHNSVVLSLAPSGVSPQSIFETLGTLAGVAGVEGEGQGGGGNSGGAPVRCTVVAKGGKPIATAVSQLVKAKGWQVETMKVDSGRLEEVFRDLTAANGTRTKQEAQS
jgi:ABC-2 type transport system ATP-binding protein